MDVSVALHFALLLSFCAFATEERDSCWACLAGMCACFRAESQRGRTEFEKVAIFDADLLFPYNVPRSLSQSESHSKTVLHQLAPIPGTWIFA